MKNFKKNRGKQLNDKAPMRINVNPADLPEVLCECGCDTFIQGVRIRKVSALISPDGQEKYIHIPTSACVKCHTALPDKP